LFFIVVFRRICLFSISIFCFFISGKRLAKGRNAEKVETKMLPAISPIYFFILLFCLSVMLVGAPKW